MTQIPGGSRDAGLIRISAEDAAASHVDDLLRRQESLRGQQGITANRRRKWYYRNWFVSCSPASSGAMAAWAIIEPHFQDMPYYQGKIEKIDTDAIRWPARHHGVRKSRHSSVSTARRSTCCRSAGGWKRAASRGLPTRAA